MPWEAIIPVAKWSIVFSMLGLLVLWLRGDPTIEEQPSHRRWTPKDVEDFKTLKRMNRRR